MILACIVCIIKNSIILNESCDLEIQGFPGESKKSYELYASRKMSYKHDQNSNDEPLEIINIFDNMITKYEDHFIIGYTHQTTCGQSGGPLILHLKK